MNDSGTNVDGSSILCNDCGPIEWVDWMSCSYRDDLAIFRFYYAEDTPQQPDWSVSLHPDEMERGWRYHRRDDRLRSLYTRSLLRILVGKYTHRNPLEVRLTTGLGNKPELVDNPEWRINATHSGNWILLAVGKSSVGIDVEKVEPDFTFTDVIPFAFSTPERQHLEDEVNALVRFYELWTRKEALVKATGSGIDETFAQIPALPGFHTWEPTQLAAAGAWAVDSFYVAEGYPAAIAYNGSPGCLQFYTLDHGIFTSLHKR